MKVITHTITHQANFAGGRSRLDLLLPSFLPSREEKKKQERRKQSIDSGAEWHTPHMDRVRTETKMQERIFFPLRGHAVGRMRYAPTTCRQETLFPINSRKERIETKMQEQKNRPLGSRAQKHTPHTDRVRTETKMQERIFCPLRGHTVGRMQYAPTSYWQETLFPINSQEERTETKMQKQKNRPLGSRGVLHTPHTDRVRTETKTQEQKNRPLGSRGVLHTPHTDRVRIETKMQERIKQSIDSGAEWHNPHTDRVRIETKKQDRIFCPLRGHAVGRMQYAPTSCRQETLFPINFREERIETKMQERRKQSIDSGVEWHTPFMRQGKRDVVWRDTFLEQRARVAIWRDRRLEEKSSHARLQVRISRENSKPYKSSLVALSEQLRDIFAA